ncbi:hypothetical protein EJB05_05849 [Eragrostis curvula]|uniref:Uncharacterized protein n=1 Tax=Eragrostis curvula TaxID=38414 RepID=A0A5J9WE65_9POAL|nr:hypothetical protein EJB05_05849 [Eragrostis curvula]
MTTPCSGSPDPLFELEEVRKQLQLERLDINNSEACLDCKSHSSLAILICFLFHE